MVFKWQFALIAHRSSNINVPLGREIIFQILVSVGGLLVTRDILTNGIADTIPRLCVSTLRSLEFYVRNTAAERRTYFLESAKFRMPQGSRYTTFWPKSFGLRCTKTSCTRLCTKNLEISTFKFRFWPTKHAIRPTVRRNLAERTELVGQWVGSVPRIKPGPNAAPYRKTKQYYEK
jgi:hypothetical protein